MTTLKRKDQSFRRTRREFAKRLAAVAATPLVATADLAIAAETVAAQPSQAPANPFAPQAEALAEVVRRRYPDHLTGEQLDAVKRGLERALRNGEALRKFDLGNGDEPAFVFNADVPGGAAGVESRPEPDRKRAGGGSEEDNEGRSPRNKRRPRRNG